MSSFASVAGAATDYWDGDGLGTVGGGPGQWDTSLSRWAASPASSTYGPFVNNDTAVFGGAGGNVNITAGVTANVDFQSNGYLIQGNFTLPSAAPTVNVAGGVFAALYGSASTASPGAGLTKTGGGMFAFSNTLLLNGGPVNVNGGRLSYFRAGATLTQFALVNVAAGASLDLGKFNDTIGTLSGAGSIVLGSINDATTVNSSTPSYVWGSTLTVNADGGTSTFAGSIVDDGAPLPQATFSGGHLVKAGTGMLTLSGTASTFRGSVLVQAGKLVVASANAIPAAAPVVLSNTTTFQLASPAAVGSLGNPVAEASTAITGVVDVNSSTLTIGGDNLHNEFSGLLAGSGTVVKVGSGKQFINSSTGSSTYTGRYVIQGGILGFGGDLRWGVVPAAPVANYFTLDGGTLAPAILTAATTMSTNANRGITVTANGGGLYYNNPTGTSWSIAAPISGTGPLTRSGPATINLQGNNSGFAGNWVVTDGITNVGSDLGAVFGTTAGLGNKPAGTGSWDMTAARLQLATNAAIAGGFQTYNLAAGAGSTFSYGPGVVLTIGRNGNSKLTVTVGDPAATSSTFIRKPNGSMLINVASGPLNLGLATSSEQLVFKGNVPTVTTNGGADTILPGVLLTTADNSTEGFFATHDNQFGFGIQVAGVTSKTNINTADNTDVFIADPTTVNTLTADRSVYAVKVGQSGSATTLSLGTGILHVGGGASTDPAMVIVGSSGVVTASGAGAVDFGTHEGIIYTQVNAGTWSTNITGSGGLTKMGWGALTFSGVAALSYTGPTRIEQGQLSLAATNQLPVGTDLIFCGAPNTTLSNNPTLLLNGRTVTVNSVNTLNAAAGITTNAGGAVIALGTNGVLKITGSGTSVFNGQITKAGTTSTIWNSGTGSLQLGMPDSIFSDRGAVMTYDKLWNTGGGTVILETSQDLNVFPTFGGTILADAYQLDGGSTFRFPGIPGAGIGGDTTSLGGTLTINTGRGFRLGSGAGTTGTGTIQVDNPYMQISLAGTGGINGTGTLTKTGPGILLLPTSSGTTAARWKLKVNGGVVIIQDDGSLGLPPSSFQPDNITLDNGGAIDTRQASAGAAMTLGVNRGITIGPGGGAIRSGFGQLNIAAPLVGTGPLRLVNTDASTTRTRTFSGISDGTAAGAVAAYTGTVTLACDSPIYANAKSALGIGTITNDPTTSVQFGTSLTGPITLASAFAINPGHTWDWSINSPNGDLTLTGVISGGGAMYKGLNNISAGTLELSNASNSFTGDFVVSQGTLAPLADGALGSASSRLIVNSTGLLALKGNLNYTSPKPLFITSNVSVGLAPAISNTSGDNRFAGVVTLTAAAAIQVAAGTLTLSNDIVGGAGSPLTKTGTALLAAKDIRTAGLSISAGTVKILPSGGAASGVSNVRTLSISAGTKVDLTDNKLVTAAAIGTLSGSNYTDVTGSIQTGRNGGGWGGATGIVTSQTEATTGNFTSIAVATAAQVKSIAATDTATWAGQTVSGSDTLVMYTYGGDANLDGKINVDDYGHIDSSIPIGLSGWYNGDFNYDGKINVDDYGIIDFNIGIQGPAFFAGPELAATPRVAGLSDASPVPEPALTALLLGGALMLLRWRKRSPAACLRVPR